MSFKTIYKCDRCGKEWEYKIENGYGNDPKHIKFDDLKHLDLCNECWNSFHTIINLWEKQQIIMKNY